MHFRAYLARIFSKTTPTQATEEVPSVRVATFDSLMALASKIRPGMHTDEVDQLASQSDGMITAASLNVNAARDGGGWTSDVARPCSIVIGKNGMIRAVTFDVENSPVPELLAEMSIDAVRAAFPDCRDQFQKSSPTSSNFTSVILRQDGQGSALIAQFYKAKLKSVIFRDNEFTAQLEQYAREDEANEVARLSAAKEKREKMLAWRRTAHPDEVLRDWAGDHSTWGESPTEWQKFVTWLIEESTPDERHTVIQNYNWDHGIDIPLWIIRQSDTHRATIIKIFWLSEPSYFVSALEKGEPVMSHYETTQEMIVEIGEKLATSFYQNSEHVTPIVYKGRKIDNWHDTNTGKLLLPLDVFNAVEGRQVSLSNTPWNAPVRLDILC